MAVHGTHKFARGLLMEVIWKFFSGLVPTVVLGTRAFARMLLLEGSWKYCNGLELMAVLGIRERAQLQKRKGTWKFLNGPSPTGVRHKQCVIFSSIAKGFARGCNEQFL